MADNSKIALKELEEIFDDGLLPMAALQLLAKPGYRTVDEVRAMLREIRAQQEPRRAAKRDLKGAVRAWWANWEKHQLKYTEAAQILAEVSDEFDEGGLT